MLLCSFFAFGVLAWILLRGGGGGGKGGRKKNENFLSVVNALSVRFFVLSFFFFSFSLLDSMSVCLCLSLSLSLSLSQSLSLSLYLSVSVCLSLTISVSLCLPPPTPPSLFSTSLFSSALCIPFVLLQPGRQMIIENAAYLDSSQFQFILQEMYGWARFWAGRQGRRKTEGYSCQKTSGIIDSTGLEFCLRR